jgi:hypothetical protein
MRYTESQQLPYPATRREAANAPLASELLARAAADKLQTLNTSWTAEMLGPTVILTLTSNITGIPAATDWSVFMNNVLQDRPVGWNLGSQTIAVREAGWYHCFCYLHVSSEGAVSAGSRRRLRVDIQGSSDPFGSNVVTESYVAENNERNGSVGLGLEFVTFLRPSYSVFSYFSHTNGTTCRVDSTLTQYSFTKICPEV